MPWREKYGGRQVIQLRSRASIPEQGQYVTDIGLRQRRKNFGGHQISNGTAVAGSVSHNATTRVATFTPSVLLGSLTPYAVNVRGVKDLAGNAMASPFTTRRTLFADNFESGAGAWLLPAPSAGAPWSLTTVNFHSSNHSHTRIRFRFESNATKNFDGVYVDDIIIQSP